MYKRLRHAVTGDRIFFTAAGVLTFFLLLTGFISRFSADAIRGGWRAELGKKNTTLKERVLSGFTAREQHLLDVLYRVKQEVKKDFTARNFSAPDVFASLAAGGGTDIAMALFNASGELTAWNNLNRFQAGDFQIWEKGDSSTRFYTARLHTYLLATDTLRVGQKTYTLAAALCMEKSYQAVAPGTAESYQAVLEQELGTQVSVFYSPIRSYSPDGRYYAFDLLNRAGRSIGGVQLQAPQLNAELSRSAERYSELQSVLIAAILLLLGAGVRADVRNLRLVSLRILLFTGYFAFLRWLLFRLNLPGMFIEGDLVNPNNFASSFGEGIVRSPIELLTTTVFLIGICVYLFNSVMDYYSSRINRIPYSRFKLAAALLPALAVALLAVRGLAASTKSIIFDSTLRYFKEPDIIPAAPHLVMNLSLVFLGTSVVLAISALLLIVFTISGFSFRGASLKDLGVAGALTAAGAALYPMVQREPLITPVLLWAVVALLLLNVFLLNYYPQGRFSMVLHSSIIASIISISMMNFFNSELERGSLKTTALEMNRPTESLFNFLITGTLGNATRQDQLIFSFFTPNTNYDALAFSIWSRSALSEESVNSAVIILNREKKVLGYFSSGIRGENLLPPQLNSGTTDDLAVFPWQDRDGKTSNRITGISPVKERDLLLGYIVVTIEHSKQLVNSRDIPPILRRDNVNLNSVVNTASLNIFRFRDNDLEAISGSFYPDRQNSMKILAADYGEFNEAWLELAFNNEEYIFYCLAAGNGGTREITAIGLKSREIEWDLFNFFKLFILHSIIIFGFYLLSFLPRFEAAATLKLSFRAQLLTAFLTVSLLPLIAIALYNRQNTAEKSELAIREALSDRADVITALAAGTGGTFSADAPLEKLSGTNIAFQIYRGGTLAFAAKSRFYRSGLFNSVMDGDAFVKLVYLGFNDYFAAGSIDGKRYHTYYRKLEGGPQPVILAVDNALNPVNIVFSPVEIDIILYGIYSFAVLVIIIISTLLANRISFPIQKLTKATRSIAHGDLNITLSHSEKGEIKELIDGFIFMKNELRKNQEELGQLERETAWKEIARQVAHEIKNPLTPMKLTMQHLVASYRGGSQNFDKIFERVTSTILNQIDNLNQIAGEFSSFARMPGITVEDVPLMPILEEIKALFSEEQAQVTVAAEGAPESVRADASQLKRILINLVRNSIQAGATAIRITAAAEASEAVLLVWDNGSGIPDEVQGKIFSMNFTTKSGGMGIGLKMSKRFIEAFGGAITLAGSVPGNTTFRVTLPAAGISTGDA